VQAGGLYAKRVNPSPVKMICRVAAFEYTAFELSSRKLEPSVRAMRLTACFLLVFLPAASLAEEPKGIVVKFDSLTSLTPADWKSEKPSNRLRSYQFRLPGLKGEKDAEIYIFPDLINTVNDNFTRYKADFQAPEGMTVDDFAKTATIEVGKAKVSILDITGTWLYKDRPFDKASKVEPRPDSRVISAIFHTDDGNYLIRVSGPAPTVTAHAKAFYDWIKAFK